MTLSFSVVQTQNTDLAQEDYKNTSTDESLLKKKEEEEEKVSQHPKSEINAHYERMSRRRRTLYISHIHLHFTVCFSGMVQASSHVSKSHYGSQSFRFSSGEVSGPQSFSTGTTVLIKPQPSFSRFFCFILRF